MDNINRVTAVKESVGDLKNLDIFNGIRVLSIFWVIYGHDYFIRF
jgi:hypothetical protein